MRDPSAREVSDDEVPAAGVLDAPRCGHRARDVHDCCDRIQRGRGSDALDVVDAVLKADNQRVASDMAGKLSCRLFGVVALHTEEHQLRIRGCRNVG